MQPSPQDYQKVYLPKSLNSFGIQKPSKGSGAETNAGPVKVTIADSYKRFNFWQPDPKTLSSVSEKYFPNYK